MSRCTKACEKKVNTNYAELIDMLKNLPLKLESKAEALKKFNKEKKKAVIIDVKACEKVRCNVGCKKTIFQSGPVNKLPNGILSNKTRNILGATKNAMLDKALLKQRKNIFGNKTNVLKEDGFYEKFPAKTVKNMKKAGFVSACAIKLID